MFFNLLASKMEKPGNLEFSKIPLPTLVMSVPSVSLFRSRRPLKKVPFSEFKKVLFGFIVTPGENVFSLTMPIEPAHPNMKVVGKIVLK